MKCIEISKPGGPEVLVPAERPTPAPKDGEILVKVVAAGVNRPDVLQRMGRYPIPPGASDLPGLEIAGEVVACGAGVKSSAVPFSKASLTKIAPASSAPRRRTATKTFST